jgi:hypothetical protein
MARRSKQAAAAAFRETFGPGDRYRDFDDADEKRLADRLPEAMRDILRADGWCSYKDQVLWLCDPDDWKTAARAWFDGAPAAQVLARTGFGDLVVWDGEIIWFVLVHEATAMSTVDDGDWFFSKTITARDLAPRSYLPKRVRAAREAAGPLAWDEMYTYEPALALGGDPETSRVQRVKAREALVMLAGLAPIQRT